MKTLKLTQEGLDKLKEELEKKKEQLRKLGVYKASAAANEGDTWHDNFAFEQTEIQERALIHQINDLQRDIDNAEIISVEGKKTAGKVSVGSKVTVSLKYPFEDEEELTFCLTGDFGSANIDDVSVNSPIGECILGKEVGFEGQYTVNGNDILVKILRVDY